MGGRETPEQEALCDEPCKMLMKQNTKVICVLSESVRDFVRMIPWGLRMG